jgi:glycosyltransferase involved in cell wall biosynthesis
LLIEAWLRAFPDRAIGLHIAGTLSDNDERLAAKAGIARSKPDDATLRQLYVQALAVAVPSTSEGYGLMSVEAMACGAPVLAADAAGLPEACDGAALLLSPTNVERWTQALRDIATGEFQRRALHERSLQRVARIDRTATPRIIAAFLRRSREGAR